MRFQRGKKVLALALAVCLMPGCTAGMPGTGAAPTAAPSASAAAAPTAAPSPVQAADPIGIRMAGMTLREKVGQLFLIRPDALDPALPLEEINDDKAAGSRALSRSMRERLADYPVGGIAMFGKNIADPGQLTTFIADLQSASGVPLLMAVDEEGGRVARLANHPAFLVPQVGSMDDVAATGIPENARRAGKTIGGYLAEYGFNLDFAPVADVNTNPDNTVIGSRAFGSDPVLAGRMVAAEVAGLHEAGIMSCLKHFPGHGDTDDDTHDGSALSDKTWQEMLSCEMIPFQAGIGAGTDLVMVAHIAVPNAASDGLPASLSQEIITHRLRGELGFDGVVITDSLAMGAITQSYSAADAAVLSLQAGADLLLMPNGLPEAFDGVMDAVENGGLDEARIDESVRRVLTLKQAYGLL